MYYLYIVGNRSGVIPQILDNIYVNIVSVSLFDK